MRVNGRSHIIERRLEPHGGDGSGNNFCSERPYCVNSQNLSILFFGDNLDETFMLAQNRGLTVSKEWELPDFYLVTGLAGLLFRQANRANLRFAAGAVG